MKKVTNKEIRKIAKGIVKTTNKSENDFDAIDGVELILKKMFDKMKISIEIVKGNINCDCENCICEK